MQYKFLQNKFQMSVLFSNGCVIFQPSHKCSEGRFVKVLFDYSDGIVLVTDAIDGYGFFILLVIINGIEIINIFVFHYFSLLLCEMSLFHCEYVPIELLNVNKFCINSILVILWVAKIVRH